MVRTRGMRCYGSAALDLCFVACGRFDGYWEAKVNPWDCLAGGLCVIEGWGKSHRLSGGTDSSIFGKGRIIASNGHIHQEMIDVVNGSKSRPAATS